MAGLLGQAADVPKGHIDYGVALAATKKAQRPLLVIIDDPNKPDRRVEQASERTNGTQSELLAAYEICRVDATTAYGQQVADSFKVREFPYTAIIDRTGSVILYQQSGQITPERWTATLASYKSGVYHAERAATVSTGTVYRSSGRRCVGCR